MSIDAQAVDVIALIARSPWFETLDKDAQQKLGAGAQKRHYDKNSFVYRTGEKTCTIYCLVSGRIRLAVTTPLGQEFALTDIEPEFWFGEQVLGDDTLRVLDAQVMEAAMVIEIPRTVVLNVARDNPDVYRLLFEEHIRRSRRLYAALPQLFYPLKARLAGRILEMIPEHGQDVEEGIFVDVQLSQNDYARLALGSRQRINRIFRDWANRGIVITQPDGYVVRDIAALQKEAQLTGD